MRRFEWCPYKEKDIDMRNQIMKDVDSIFETYRKSIDIPSFLYWEWSDPNSIDDTNSREGCSLRFIEKRWNLPSEVKKFIMKGLYKELYNMFEGLGIEDITINDFLESICFIRKPKEELQKHKNKR